MTVVLDESTSGVQRRDVWLRVVTCAMHPHAARSVADAARVIGQ